MQFIFIVALLFLIFISNINSFKIFKDTLSLQNELKYFSQENINKIENKKIRYLQTINLLTNKKYTKIENKKFTNLILEHQIPLIFTKGQIFQIRGNLTIEAPISGTYVNLIIKNKDSGVKNVFSSFVKQGKKQFTIMLNLNLPQGEYILALFNGTTGYAQQNIYKIINLKDNSTKNFNISIPRPTGLSINYLNNQLQFNWTQNQLAPLNKITFKQGISNNNIKEVSYILSNFQNKFLVNYKDFAYFSPKINVTVQLSQAYSSSNSLTNRTSNWSISIILKFQPCGHHFQEYNQKLLKLSIMIPWRIQVNQKIIISGMTYSNIQNRIIIQNSNKTISSFYLNDSEKNKSNPIITNTKIYKELTFSQPGVYILQINNVIGQAVINRPIYVGNAYPLLPDFIDLTLKEFSIQQVANGQPQSLTDQRNLYLNLINIKRKQWNIKPVKLDQKLNKIAQFHSDDMVNRNFISHINPDGLSPLDRAKKFGFNDLICQNLARNVNLTDAHYRLCRSPGHLQNIINPEWQKLGVGVKIDKNSNFYITEQFSVRNMNQSPLTQAEYKSYQTQIVSYILKTYLFIKSQNQTLSKTLRSWQNLSLFERDINPLGTYLEKSGFLFYSYQGVRMNFSFDFVELLKGTNYLEPNLQSFNQLGVSLKVENNKLQICVAFI